MKYVIGFAIGVLAAFVVHHVFTQLTWDNARYPFETYHKYPDSMLIVVAHNPDMEHLATIHGAGDRATLIIKDKTECEELQGRLMKMVWDRK